MHRPPLSAPPRLMGTTSEFRVKLGRTRGRLSLSSPAHSRAPEGSMMTSCRTYRKPSTLSSYHSCKHRLLQCLVKAPPGRIEDLLRCKTQAAPGKDRRLQYAVRWSLFLCDVVSTVKHHKSGNLLNFISELRTRQFFIFATTTTRQCDNVTDPQGPVRNKKKITKLLGIGV